MPANLHLGKAPSPPLPRLRGREFASRAGGGQRNGLHSKCTFALLPWKKLLRLTNEIALYRRHRLWRFRPGERRLQPVIAPKQFAIGRHETRRTEQAKLLCLFGLRA